MPHEAADKRASASKLLELPLGEELLGPEGIIILKVSRFQELLQLFGAIHHSNLIYRSYPGRVGLIIK